jgi:hypothetical protein
MNGVPTPGPWTYVPEDNIITTYAGRLIAEFQPRRVHVGVEERNANGFLIAAAPDLLAALEYAIEAEWNGVHDPVWAEGARAAIKKAKGQ